MMQHTHMHKAVTGHVEASPSRCTLAKATDQHHERAAARLATRR